MDEINKLYKELNELENEKNKIQGKIYELGGLLNSKENEYYSQLRLCRACKRSLLDCIDVYCDDCLGDTEIDE